jgi:DNA-binding transcriptional MerR regulator
MKFRDNLDIGEVAKQSGLPVTTLRYYEDKGLIQSRERHGLRRQFGPHIIEQLEFISLGRRAGFSLEELQKMFSSNERFKIDRRILLERAGQLTQNIKRLMAIRDCLEHVANCPASSHIECPKFQKLLRLARKSEERERKRKRVKSSVGARLRTKSID